MMKRDHVERLMDAAQALSISMKDEPLSRSRLAGYVKFLLMNDDDRPYGLLADFLEWYGDKYVLPKIVDLIIESELPKTHVYDKIVEFGPGTGWLIGRLADAFPHAKHYAVDKRQYIYKHQAGVIFFDRDLEHADEIQDLKRDIKLTENSLIVANQFLHCVDHPERVIDEFSEQAWLVVEVDSDPMLPHWGPQMKQFGASPISDRDLSKTFEQAGKNGFRRTWRSPMPGLVLSLFEPK